MPATTGLHRAVRCRRVWIGCGRLAQLVRASRLHRECRGFKSLTAHLFFQRVVRHALDFSTLWKTQAGPGAGVSADAAGAAGGAGAFSLWNFTDTIFEMPCFSIVTP